MDDEILDAVDRRDFLLGYIDALIELIEEDVAVSEAIIADNIENPLT